MAHQTRAQMFLAVKRQLRLHPGWTDEQLAEAEGIPAALAGAVIAPARREAESEPGFLPGSSRTGYMR